MRNDPWDRVNGAPQARPVNLALSWIDPEEQFVHSPRGCGAARLRAERLTRPSVSTGAGLPGS